ncbi:MAG: hypothetical protein ACPGLV_12410 [Bacteroidia bacterium]
MNKYEAAYNMLMILSIVDGEFNSNEGDVIIEYLRDMHEPYIGTENENKTFSDLTNDQLTAHFEKSSYDFYKKHPENERQEIFEGAARDFYEHSLASDQKVFIDFAKKIIVADNKITKQENQYINQLFKLWGLK